jgi:hypothetical protein
MRNSGETWRVGTRRMKLAISSLLLAGSFCQVQGQVEVTPWGNLMGFRTPEGQLLQFDSSLRIVRPDWSGFYQSTNYNEKTKYTREGKKQTVAMMIDNLPFTEVVEDTGKDSARVAVSFTPGADREMAGTYLCIDLPSAVYAGSTAQLLSSSSSNAKIALAANPPAGKSEYVRASGKGIRITSSTRQLEITMSAPGEIVVRQDFIERPASLNDPMPRQSFVKDGTGNPDIQVYLPVIPGNAVKGKTYKNVFSIKAGGEIDRSPIQLKLDPTKPGRAYDGIGGNFRLWVPKVDSQIIDYNLANLPVKWGRIAMWWTSWHPDEFVDPTEQARAGKLEDIIYRQMELARRLNQLNIKIIVSNWIAPQWAIPVEPDAAGLRGDPLNPGKMGSICQSIVDYLVFLKEKYGVEAALFSFNESDIGVNIRQTGAEHAAFIKQLGSMMIARGLATRMLLGDTAHCTPAAHDFLQAALDDPETYQYIGAVAFHTWRGCTDSDLKQWSDSAKRLNVPLIASESGPDASAHQNPIVFLERWYQHKEIDYYLRVLSVGEVRSIMEWQFAGTYALLTGGGIYDTTGPMRPTQRFWNFKQLGLTPEGSFHLPISADRPAVNCAAFGDISQGTYSIHVTNGGAARPATLSGIPDSVKEFHIYVTDINRGMAEGKPVPVINGTASFTLDAVSYTTLMSSKEKRR